MKRCDQSLADMVHHIKPLSEYPELALVLKNLLSLCNSCHNKEHPGGGKKVETPVTNRRARFIVSKGNSEVF
ncbi:endonuclease [Paenibacillus odorifer]|nr:endonuclease [Paenibacillus odorifer]